MIPGINEGLMFKNNTIILSKNQNKIRNCKRTFPGIKNVSKKIKYLETFEVIWNKKCIIGYNLVYPVLKSYKEKFHRLNIF